MNLENSRSIPPAQTCRHEALILLEHKSCDWMTCRSQVIMLTVESVGQKDDLKQQTKCVRKWQVVLFVSQQKSVEATNRTEDK